MQAGADSSRHRSCKEKLGEASKSGASSSVVLMIQLVEQAAQGAFMGAAVGNAVGSMLLIGRRLSPEEVEMGMNWQTQSRRASGQVASDAEMAICMAQALVNHPAGSLPVAELMSWYIRWSQSNPSGHGQTLQNAMHVMQLPSASPEHTLAAIADGRQNSRSKVQSNGSLMRAVPLAIWGHRLSATSLADCARQESALTHPCKECCDAVATYDIALAHLIGHPGDREGALEAAKAWANAHACPTVQGWLSKALHMQQAPSRCCDNIEWVRWPFQIAFMHLAKGSGYEEGLRMTLGVGGEPGTKAAVVGGMLGALHGIDAIPKRLQDDVLACTEGSRGITRADFMQTSLIPELTRKLLLRAESIA